MNRSSRRVLLRRLPALIMLAAAVAGCQPGTTPTPAQVVTFAANLAGGLSTAIEQLAVAAPTLIPAPLLAQLRTYLSLAQAAAQQLSTTLPAASAAVTVKVVIDNVNAVLAVLAGPPINGLIPSPFNVIIGTAAIVLPVLEQFVLPYLSGATASASPAMLKVRSQLGAPAATMSPEQANALLQAVARKGV